MSTQFPDDPNRTGLEPLSEPSTTTAIGVIERPEVEEQIHEPGDHERFSHYVRKEKIVESAVTGAPVTALCGKVWVPGRTPDRFPVCPDCKRIYEEMPKGDDGDDDN
ncbi:DUF3039 domain-containing protein [Kribbia dieselivorans]|uniref:DUF3039 domain-containing protein n=1 Tax=Kribbia dieselivorans TaxID=331526 RepID=UPI0009F949AD|nr:DUF3039 domain-containing protein [Kribbia dieselivorans]